MAIEGKEVRHVAKLAKLTFADNEIPSFYRTNERYH